MLDPGVYHRALQKRQNDGGFSSQNNVRLPPQEVVPGTTFYPEQQEIVPGMTFNQSPQEVVPGTTFMPEQQQGNLPDLLQLLMMILGGNQ